MLRFLDYLWNSCFHQGFRILRQCTSIMIYFLILSMVKLMLNFRYFFPLMVSNQMMIKSYPHSIFLYIIGMSISIIYFPIHGVISFHYYHERYLLHPNLHLHQLLINVILLFHVLQNLSFPTWISFNVWNTSLGSISDWWPLELVPWLPIPTYLENLDIASLFFIFSIAFPLY